MGGSSVPVFLCIDGGTESVRAALVSGQGELITQEVSRYPTMFPQSGYAIQRPDDWRGALIEAVRGCLRRGLTKKTELLAVCTDATTCTLLPLDDQREPLSDALMWMDVRASAQAERIHDQDHASLSYCPAGVAAEWMLPKVLWLKDHMPDVYRRTRFFIEYQDWFSLFLTDEMCLNLNTITQRWLYNNRSWKWPIELYQAVGLEDLVDKIPQRIVAPGSPVGRISKTASQLTGIPRGIPVVEGGGDAPVAMLGLGAVKPGSVGLITGSSNVIAGFSRGHLSGEGFFGTFPDAVIPGLELIEAGQVSTGSILSWFRGLVMPEMEVTAAYGVLEDEAGTYPPGSGGVVSLDSFQGNRTPFTDSLLRGAIWGLSLGTKRGQIYRSLMESVVYGTQLVLDTFSGNGYEVADITACGGGTKSAMLMQMYADVCGRPIHTVKIQDAPLIGCAALAAWGSGIYSDIQGAVAEMVKRDVVYSPDPGKHEEYHKYYRLYVDTYAAMKGLMHHATYL